MSHVVQLIRVISLSQTRLLWLWVAMYGLSSSSLEGASYGGPLLACHTANSSTVWIYRGLYHAGR